MVVAVPEVVVPAPQKQLPSWGFSVMKEKKEITSAAVKQAKNILTVRKVWGRWLDSFKLTGRPQVCSNSALQTGKSKYSSSNLEAATAEEPCWVFQLKQKRLQW